MAEQLFNDLTSVALNGAIDNSQTSITVSASLSVSGNFRIRIDDELLQVTAVATTTWTVVRGVESSVAASHLDTSVIHIVATAAGLNQWLADTASLGVAYAVSRSFGLP